MRLIHGDQRTVTVLTLRRLAAGVVFAAAAASVSSALAAQGGPSPQYANLTASGSYLAARHAGTERDAQSAAEYYRSALRHDPKNGELLERAFLSFLADG